MGRPKGSKNKVHTRVQIKCITCKTIFEVDNARKDIAKHCSYKCYWKSMEGTTSGANNPSWKGGKYKKTDGYIMSYNPSHPKATSDGYIREHRLVMEKHLGRYLAPIEVVHHINSDTQDNRIENLQLFKNNGEHMKFHTYLRKLNKHN